MRVAPSALLAAAGGGLRRDRHSERLELGDQLAGAQGRPVDVGTEVVERLGLDLLRARGRREVTALFACARPASLAHHARSLLRGASSVFAGGE